MHGFFVLLNMIGGLGLFLYGMHQMSDGLRRRAGDRLRKLLQTLTSNRVFGVITGASVTTIIQSSSATTILLVSLVNASLMTLEQAIGVVMGANIGTTFTAWIVSLLGFKFKITSLALPAVAVALPFFFSRIPKRREWSEILLGFGILFMGLSVMKESVPDISKHPEALEFVQHLVNAGFWSVLLFILLGTLLTIVVQSSSAAMAITLTMAYSGWIDFEIAAAIVLGENIGTTITAFLASLGMSPNAKRTARVHMVFNIVGVAWMLAVYQPFLQMVDQIVPGGVNDPHALPVHLAAFHTLFNLANTTLLIGFVPQLARLARVMVRPREHGPAPIGTFHVSHVRTRTTDALEADLVSARAEVGRMAVMVHDMLLKGLNAYHSSPAELEELREESKRTEKLTDQMQDGITEFLTDCMKESVTELQAQRIFAMQKVTSELESIADSAYRLVQLFRRKVRKGMGFHEHADEQLYAYTSEILDFLKYNADYLTYSVPEYNFDTALRLNRALKKTRKGLRKNVNEEIASTPDADVGGEVLFIDLVRHLERIGERNLNIAQAIQRLNENAF
ncbi:Na/Pi cotransporter family protein [Kiritimatiella glycovorans]|uniref:Na/Pi-cotransporter II-related protein n=1 Tax=Kiritimatiella glycovorans TaxID=1307763 RepID=A0A0G3ED60_9BACT|nr:Na/Pi cotransporter family protein [Kiritimatiella glycovorans]AKJ64411.1 Na/Pi-cotransporter II-related protein [Kiritimatiella glycovorans]